ncbi:hypothetical protein NT2_05_00440 [Caenibius tardaugens NBRC 16725]|uniref:HIG1 domain-containing protein n=1 Tax=Caenibius tardaugens NBRC 16725 TaxID=1219035 RepID=U3A2Y5_9SPHN|nr:HIG1 domain-containing protein [Caenibius tardaugens]AZI36488.1 hypothetical protein EGO55_11430 [Caenibius tardaugens NBRC 16725]GAD49123.1 hypothetical protein NT2_05_00440 [Caenibius tardaugens NBRC 16725]
MNYILIPLLIVFMIMVVVSLVRGVVAFLQSSRDELDRDPNTGPSPLQLRQNQMMFSRIKYQALAIVVVAVILMVAGSNR